MTELQKYRWELLLKLNGMVIPAAIVEKMKTTYKTSTNASPEMLSALNVFLKICMDKHNYRMLAVYDIEKAMTDKETHRAELQASLGMLEKSKNYQAEIDFMLSDIAIRLITEIYERVLAYCFNEAKKSGLVELSLLCDELRSDKKMEECLLFMKKLLHALSRKPFSILMFDALSLVFIHFKYVGNDEAIVLYKLLQKNDFFISHHAQKLRAKLCVK